MLEILITSREIYAYAEFVCHKKAKTLHNQTHKAGVLAGAILNEPIVIFLEPCYAYKSQSYLLSS
jgi:hypothetical protein